MIQSLMNSTLYYENFGFMYDKKKQKFVQSICTAQCSKLQTHITWLILMLSETTVSNKSKEYQNHNQTITKCYMGIVFYCQSI